MSWGFEVDFDRRSEDTYHSMMLLEQRIGDQLYDPEPMYDDVLTSLDRPTLVTLQYELNRALDKYRSHKSSSSMGDLKFTTAKDFVYPGSDPQT